MEGWRESERVRIPERSPSGTLTRLPQTIGADRREADVTCRALFCNSLSSPDRETGGGGGGAKWGERGGERKGGERGERRGGEEGERDRERGRQRWERGGGRSARE